MALILSRCGIVLCNRDAKFAVDCDTCRLSYCLVCLASGGKDPCVRCGHRPSKRMEQLVHLRLKSIYKAFKQSSNTNGGPMLDIDMVSSPSPSSSPNGRGDGVLSSEDPEALLHAAATAAKSGARVGKAGRRQEASRVAHTNRSTSVAASKIDFKHQKEKADAAAAELLAELEQEEEKEKSKKKKKKKKKERIQAKREELKQVEEQENNKDKEESTVDASTGSNSDSRRDLQSSDIAIKEPPASKDQVPSNEDNHGTDADRQPDADPLEDELVQLVKEEDITGIERLLLSIKGVPGKAVLRKNAKKAIKRINAANEPEQPLVEDVAPANDEIPDSSSPLEHLLKVVSIAHNKTPTEPKNARARTTQAPLSTECVMKMSPSIVGLVIGKGGQRIRDMMEESGARIWIDQESMAPSDARNVFVSGDRKNVNTAVALMKDLVANSPLATRQSGERGPDTVKTAAIKRTLGDASGKTEIVANTTSAPLRLEAGEAVEVITCDACFVPLLIGRRGWTIKNIQDSSMARVDIDQSVTPRAITISGKEEHVQVAAKMVRDVLSYPPAQLQGNTPEPGGEYNVPPLQPEVLPNGVPPDSFPSPTGPKSPLPELQPHPHSPPPSSLIMNNDAKSTISVSSSLSSTPEPSMASTKAAFAPPVTAANVLPPLQGAAYGELRNPILLNAMAQGQPMDHSALYPRQNKIDGRNEPFFQPHMPSPFQQRQVIPDIPSQLSTPNDSNFSNHFRAAGAGSAMFHQPPGHPGDSSLPVLQPPTVENHQYPAPGGLDVHVPPLSLPPQSNSSGLWGQAPPVQPRQNFVHNMGHHRPPVPPKSDAFQISAAVDFLQHSQQTDLNPSSIPAKDFKPMVELGPPPIRTKDFSPMVEPGRHLDPPSATFQPRQVPSTDFLTARSSGDSKMDSKMVDSLFGPLKPAESSLLSGLQDLSLNREDSAAQGGGLWGDLPPVEVSGSSSMFAKTNTTKRSPFMGQEASAHSHFTWGE